MITFATKEEFEDAVIQVIIDKLGIKVWTSGHPFVTGVEVGITNNDDYSGCLISGSDSVS